MSDESGRSLLDEEGRLFGLVNIIDVLVVLLFLAVLVAGIAFVSSSSGDTDTDTDTDRGETPATRYVTLEMVTQRGTVAEQINAGDVWETETAGHALTITDVYRFNTDDGVRVVARAEINGTVTDTRAADSESGFEFLGEPLRWGRNLTVETTEYEANGTVTQVDHSGDELPVRETGIVVESQLSSTVLSKISSGDEFRVTGTKIAEVRSLVAFPTDGDQHYALIGLSIRGIDRDGTFQFGGHPTRIGSTVTFSTAEYAIAGDVLVRNASEVDTEQRPFVVQSTVPTAVADDIEAGDEFRIGNTSIITVEEVTVYATGNAEQRRVVLGVSALTRMENNALLFGNRQLQLGSSLPVETGEYDLSGEIVRRGSLEEPGTPTTRTVRLHLDNIRPERAEIITEGLTERVGDTPTAEILEKSEEPAVVILTSEDGDIFQREHPRNLDVDLTVELRVRELDDGTLRFRGQQLRTGEQVTLDLGTLTVSGELIAFEDG